jgi:2-hydroxychromene-2-carboxylate isomerase
MRRNHDGFVTETPTFLYDVGEPWCWLAGERVMHSLGVVPVWQPVYAGGLPGPRAAIDPAAVDAAAAEQGLPPLRWPEPWPFDTEVAMLGATFAKQTGRAVAYSLAAMRQVFAAGRDLSVVDNVVIAAAACELHPRALLKAIETAGVRTALQTATAEAAAAGVGELPAIVVDGTVVSGPRAVEEAAALIAS